MTKIIFTLIVFSVFISLLYARNIHIVGGGIGGLTSAHELSLLAPEGTEIHIYEKSPIQLGGKARSIQVPDSGKDGRGNLWGEVCLDKE